MGSDHSPPGPGPRRRLLLVAALGAILAIALVVGLLVASAGSDAPAFRGSAPPVRLVAPSFALADERGTLVRGDELRGRVVVLTFLSTNCRAQCPPTASTIRVAIAELREEERADVAVLAISIDPEFDTAAAATEFLDERRLAGVLRYLVGTVEELQPVWDGYQVLSSVDTGSRSPAGQGVTPWSLTALIASLVTARTFGYQRHGRETTLPRSARKRSSPTGGDSPFSE